MSVSVVSDFCLCRYLLYLTSVCVGICFILLLSVSVSVLSDSCVSVSVLSVLLAKLLSAYLTGTYAAIPVVPAAPQVSGALRLRRCHHGLRGTRATHDGLQLA